LFTLFDAAAFRWAAAGLFASPDPCVVATLELLRFRFASFVTSVFILALVVLLALRTTLVFDAGLLLPAWFRALDDDAPLDVRFDVDFTVDAGPVFFVFVLVVFFDLLRTDIVNLSTREHSRTHSKSVHEHCSSKQRVDFCPRNHLRLAYRRPATSARRLIGRLAQIRRKIKEEDGPARLAATPLATRTTGAGGTGLIALPRLRRKKLSEFVGSPIEFLGVGRRISLACYIWPGFGVVSVQLKPRGKVGFGVRLDCFCGAFRFAHAAIDAFVGMNDEHVFTLVEAIDWAYLYAI
jgi:hypothetical protein